MKELVETIVKALVKKPEAVDVSLREEGDTLVVEVRADSDDLGRIIGKDGKIAKVIRTVVKAASVKDGRKVYVDIVQ